MAGERVLLVDADVNPRSILEAALRYHGFEVTGAGCGREALAVVAEGRTDLVVLDVTLPDLDGFDVCRRMRTEGRGVPVIFLSERDSLADRVAGLSLGGDDYVAKPFSLDELVARLETVLRRSGGARRDDPQLTCGDLVMDDSAHTVVNGGREVALTPTEYNLLRYLLVNQGRVLSKAQILDAVWQYDFGGDGAVVETYIGYLRRKLGDGRQLIRTLRGVGYCLRTPV